MWKIVVGTATRPQGLLCEKNRHPHYYIHHGTFTHTIDKKQYLAGITITLGPPQCLFQLVANEERLNVAAGLSEACLSSVCLSAELAGVWNCSPTS